jgi:S-adenosylmethionine-diacylglycerol 3-amino-3-carboxypropyl transferase
VIADEARQRSGPSERTLARQPFFEGIGYASCWEDASVLRAALRVRRGDTVLSITSGGCNALALLLDDPARVVAVDFNPHQNRLMRLKMAALRHLSHDEVLALIGVRPSTDRLALWARLRPHVPAEDRSWWDARPGHVAAGLYRAGRTDRYLMAFGRLVRAWLGQRRVDQLFAFTDLDAQRAFYHEVWDDWRWRTMLGVFFHRRVISRAKDPSHFRYVDGSAFGARIHARASLLFTEALMRDNPYCALILRGRYLDGAALPAYLAPEAFEVVRARLDRIELVDGPLTEVLEGAGPDTFDAYNLSNLYDWLSDEARTASLRDVVRTARAGARLCYWSTLVPRPLPSVSGIAAEAGLAAALHRRDRFPYAHLEVASVSRPVPDC